MISHSDIQQRSPEWYAARKGRVTGSNIGAILGLSPFKTADDVMRAMVREYHDAEREFQGNVATEYGTFHEDGARLEYEMDTGNKVQECGFFIHPEHDWLGASPDGLVGEEGLVEIKCPYSQREACIPEFKTAIEQPHYWVQMQIEMACSGRKWVDFYQWAPKGSSCERVEFDQMWFEENLIKLEAFHMLFLKEVNNPDHLKPKRHTVESVDARKLVDELADLDEILARANDRKKEALAELVNLCGSVDTLVCGHKLTKVEREGAVSYAKVVKEHCPDVDLEPYRGKPTSYWKLT